ncbi:hypothetical protein Pfo_000778 [Paulownia fortunei]|nr:hypothetical protein Pfo_000778 [Paulownia fortunei]
MRLMDVVITYLYGSLDSDIYMKILDGFKLPKLDTPRKLYSIKSQRSLYGLKQSDYMWYHKLNTKFAIIAVYIDDMNLIDTPKELANATEYLKKEYEVKDLEKIKLCLVLSRPEDTEMVLDIFFVISVISYNTYTECLSIKIGYRHPTIIYENNAACIAQVKGGYIKGDRTKHISPKFFHTHELQKNGEIDIQGSENIYGALYSFFLLSSFYPIKFFQFKVFNKTYGYDLDLSLHQLQ